MSPSVAPRHAATLAALLLGAACTLPPDLPGDADVAPSEHARTAPAPRLLPDAAFDTVTAGTAPAAIRLDAEAAALAARAAALQARADGLQAPVVTEPERSRLEQAAAPAE